MKIFHKRNPALEHWNGAWVVWQSDWLRFILFFNFFKDRSYILQMFKQYPYRIHFGKHRWDYHV